MGSKEDKPPVCTTKFTLNNGNQIPAVGLGTWQGQNGSNAEEEMKQSLLAAIDTGYRLIDTAQYYGVEHVIGQAVRETKVPRSEITVVTKFWGMWHHDVKAAFDKSLKQLDIDYIDVFMMHWPCAMTPDEQPMEYPGQPPYWEVWKQMEKLVGPTCKNIGVSNFTQKTLERLLPDATITPQVNEVELHALNPNLKLVPYCQEKGIRVISWSTLGSERLETGKNEILVNPLFNRIAEAHGVGPGTVSLSWAVQRGVVVIPKSSKPSRLDSNIRLVELSKDEMEAINGAHESIGKLRLANIIEGIRYDYNGKRTVMGWTDEEFGWEDKNGNWLC